MDLLQGQTLVMKDCQSVKMNPFLRNKKIVIYYFSASWVDDVELLRKLKEIHAENVKRRSGMEVIYVSADKDERQFTKYFREHHGTWPAIPPSRYHLSELIRYTYGITGLPQIVVVKKEDGFIITRRGKEQLEKNGINVLVVWSEYEPALIVQHESQIELHYPQETRKSVQQQPTGAEKPVEQNKVEDEKHKDDDDGLFSIHERFMSFSARGSTARGSTARGSTVRSIRG